MVYLKIVLKLVWSIIMYIHELIWRTTLSLVWINFLFNLISVMKLFNMVLQLNNSKVKTKFKSVLNLQLFYTKPKLIR